MDTLIQENSTFIVDSNYDGEPDRFRNETKKYDKNGNLIVFVSAHDNNADGQPEEVIREMRAYDSMGNEVTHTVASDFNGDGEIDRFQITTSTYDEQGNQTSKIFEEDFDADGQTDKILAEAWEYNADGNPILYRNSEDNRTLVEEISTYDTEGRQTSFTQTTFSTSTSGTRVIEDRLLEQFWTYDTQGYSIEYLFYDDGDDGIDHVMEAMVTYDDQGSFLAFDYVLDEEADGDTDIVGTFQRTYNVSRNLESLLIDYGDNGDPSLSVIYNLDGEIASFEYSDFLAFNTPFPIKVEVSDSSGIIFQAMSSTIPELGPPSTFKGYENGNLIIDTTYQSDYRSFADQEVILYSLDGQPLYQDRFDTSRDDSTFETVNYDYSSTGSLEQKIRSYEEFDNVDFISIFGEEITTYNMDEQISSIINSGDILGQSNIIEFYSERLFSYDENGRIITETYSREEQIEENEVINPPEIVEAETKTWTYDDAFQLVSSTLNRDGDGDGDFDYQEIELHRSIFADTPTVDGKPATLFVNAANAVVGFGFQAGQFFNGELFSNTDGTVYPDDVILGTEGNDNIWAGNTGNDLIDAGNGNNTIGLGAGSSKVIAGAGDDFVYSAAATSGMNEVELGQGNNKTWLASGNHTIAAGSGDDEIGLGDGSDTVDAGDGDNVIYMIDPSGTTDGPKDVLTGIGNDWVQTGAGNDRLDLGTHADGPDSFDIAFGQGGRDTFVLNIGSGFLTIGDFVQDEDLLEIRGITFDDLGSSIDPTRNSMWVWDNVSGDVLAELQGFTSTLMVTDVTIA